MQYQLRHYRVKPGEMERFIEVWRTAVVPLRRRHGFEVVGAWCDRSSNEFVWIVGHDVDFDRAERAYYDSPERAAMDPQPGSFLDEVAISMVDSVPTTDS